MNAIVLFTAEVFGVLLRVLECQGKRWLCAEDAAKILGYRTQDGVIRRHGAHKEKLANNSIKAKINGTGHAVRLFDEEALRYLCEYSKKEGSSYLFRWLHLGGLQASCDDVIPFDAEPVKTANAGRFDAQTKSVSADAFDSKPKSENVFVFEPHPKDKNILAFKRPKSANVGAFAPPRDALGKQELYCFSLLELLIGFTSQAKDADVGDSLLADIQTSLNDLLDEVLHTNYAPELNAARYELFSSYWLEGGDV